MSIHSSGRFVVVKEYNLELLATNDATVVTFFFLPFRFASGPGGLTVTSVLVPLNSQMQTFHRHVRFLIGLKHESLLKYYGEIVLLLHTPPPMIPHAHEKPLLLTALAVERQRMIVHQQYVDGFSISQLLTQYGPFSEKVMRRYLRQVLSALAYLHEQGMAHGSIEGRRVLVDSSGRVKLGRVGFGSLFMGELQRRNEASKEFQN
jgi:serine/threonine protein kinase